MTRRQFALLRIERDYLFKHRVIVLLPDFHIGNVIEWQLETLGL